MPQLDCVRVQGRPTGAVRVSFGYVSSFGDACAVLDFVREYFMQPSAQMSPALEAASGAPALQAASQAAAPQSEALTLGSHAEQGPAAGHAPPAHQGAGPQPLPAAVQADQASLPAQQQLPGVQAAAHSSTQQGPASRPAAPQQPAWDTPGSFTARQPPADLYVDAAICSTPTEDLEELGSLPGASAPAAELPSAWPQNLATAVTWHSNALQSELDEILLPELSTPAAFLAAVQEERAVLAHAPDCDAGVPWLLPLLKRTALAVLC